MKKMKLFVFLCLFVSCSDNEFKGHEQAFSVYGQQYDIGEVVLWHSNNSTVVSQYDSCWVDKYTFFSDPYNMDASMIEKEDSVYFFTANIENEQTGNFVLSMYEEGIVVHEELQSAFGRGACVSLHLHSSDAENLKSGTYHFGTESKEFTFKGFYAVDYEFGEDKPVYATISDGKVEVTIEGDNLSVFYNCKTTNGSTLAGHYTGTYRQFDIRNADYDKEVVATINDNLLEALFSREWTPGWNVTSDPEPDYLAKAFFSSKLESNQTGEGLNNISDQERKNQIDIALAYDDAEDLIYFESPNRMRKLLWHGTYPKYTELFPGYGYFVSYSFDLRCHTKYMLVPAGFSNADFENMENDDFNFTIQNERVAFSPETVCPIFLYMENGHGVRGCIRINRIEPVTDELVNGVLYHRNAKVYFDLKYRKTQVNKDIF